MQRKSLATLVAAVLVMSAAAFGLAAAAEAAEGSSPSNRGWGTSLNRGWEAPDKASETVRD